MNDLAKLAAYAAEMDFADLPDDVIQAARLCVLDTVGVAAGASCSPLVESTLEAYRNLGETAPQVGIWGREEKMPLLRAAYLNAMMGHTLELDDVHTRSKTHIGTVVIPAAWAWAEYLGKSGKEFLEAVICGYEVMARIGMGFGVSGHRNRGWHVTCTAGTFGAAAASAKLLGLNAEQTLYAFGLAGTQSSGLWAFLEDGATCKVLHPARAAVNGMEAAILAQAGMTGPPHILEAEDGGLFPATSDAYDLSAVSQDLGTVFEILSLDKKPYPCCRSTHCAIDAALKLRRAHALTGAEIQSITVKTYLVGYKQCGCSNTSNNPVLPSDAKFSTPYTVACALIDDSVGQQHFLPETIKRPDLRELMAKVTVVADESFTGQYPGHWGCEMILTTTNGKTYSCVVQDASGSVGVPMDRQAVLEKAASVLADIWGDATEQVAAQIEQIDTCPSMPVLTKNLQGFLTV